METPETSAEFIIRIPAGALRTAAREGRPGPAPIVTALRDLVAVLSSEPPVLRPGRFTVRVWASGAYHRFRVEVPKLRRGADDGAADPADASETAGERGDLRGPGAVRRGANGAWRLDFYPLDVAGW